MNRFTLALLVLSAGASTTFTGEDARPAPARPPVPFRRADFAGPPGLQLGQAPAHVRALLGGPPSRISGQILAHRVVEQWHYGAPHYLRLTFDCPRGQTPSLVGSRRTALQEP